MAVALRLAVGLAVVAVVVNDLHPSLWYNANTSGRVNASRAQIAHSGTTQNRIDQIQWAMKDSNSREKSKHFFHHITHCMVLRLWWKSSAIPGYSLFRVSDLSYIHEMERLIISSK